MSATRPYITCRELIDFIADYFDRSINEVAAFEFERHLLACQSCRAYLATYEKTMRAGKAAMTYDDSPNEDAPEELIKAVLKVRPR